MNSNPYRRLMLGALKANGKLETNNQLINGTIGDLSKHCSILIRGENYVGLTAVTLELVKEFQKNSFDVLYIDINDSLKKNRIDDLDLNKIAICKVSSEPDLLKCLEALDENTLLVLDGMFLLDDTKDSMIQKTNESSHRVRLSRLCSTIRSKGFKFPIIATDSRKGEVIEDPWTNVIEVKKINSITRDGIVVAHSVKISAENRDYVTYINYKTGRLSEGHKIAQRMRDEFNLSNGSIYEHEGIKAKGFFNFIMEYDYNK
jgi:hypothetical protein